MWPFGSAQRVGYRSIYSAALGRSIGAHVMMCEIAHGPSPGAKFEVAHSCGKGIAGCLNPTHLRWALRSENAEDRRRHGTMPIGDAHANAKISDADVAEIRRLVASRLAKQKDLADRYGISRSTVCNIVKGKCRVDR